MSDRELGPRPLEAFRPLARWWDQIRAVLAGLVGGLLLLIYGLITVGTKDPLSLAWRALAGVIVFWSAAEVLQLPAVRRRSPIVWIGFKGRGRLLAAESDEVLAHRIDRLVAGIADLLGAHIRNQPDFHAGGDLQDWQQQTDRRTRHDSNTAGRFFEQYGSELLSVLEALRHRGVLTADEYRSFVWMLQTGSYGGALIHELPRIAAELAAASRKLRAQD